MKRLLYAFILLFGMFSVNGQSVWIGAENSDWTNPANWSAGVPTAGSIATIPANPVAPIFGGTPIINYTIQLAGMLTFNDFVYNAGNIIIFESGSVVNNAQFVNANGRVLDVDGHFENNGTLDNFGMVDVAASGSLDNEAGAIFNNNNQTLAFGPVLNAGTTNNNGDFNVIVSLDNSGNFNNFGTFESQAGSTTENRAGATNENFEGGSYSVNGIYNNLGRTLNAGDFIVQIASIFTNEDLLTNRFGGDMEVAGRIVNNSTFDVNGPLMINSIGIVENNNQINNNGGISLEICGNLIQQNTGGILGSIQNNGNVYEINGTINETNLEFGETFTDLEGRPAPVPACKRDAFIQLPESGSVTITAAEIEKSRSYGSCGAQLVSTTVTPNTFTAADAGVQIVTITVTDNFGNSASCDDFVTVLPFTPPIVLVDDPDIDFECPEDITATPEPGAQFAAASFITPEATTTCTPSVPTSVTLCPDVDELINGFDFIGQVGGSKYFVSHDAEDWFTANNIAQANGGHLVTIDDEAENHFIRDNINPSSGSVWTGFRSLNNADNFSWESGAPVDFTNWSSGEPNNSDGDSNIAARLRRDNGTWTDRSTDDHFEFVIEISCTDVEIAGFDFLGENDGSLYYESDVAVNWTDAMNAATAIGGSLVTINNQAENDFVQNAINPSFSGSIWTGLSNNNNGNNFVWQSGQPVNYTNWNPGEPNETAQPVAARLIKSDGVWTDRPISNNFEFVVELPVPTMAPTCTPTGSITREVWTNISGTSVSQIPLNTTPDLTEDINLFEVPTNSGFNYGTRVSGFIHPTVSGDYRFWIASDDNGELWLSTDNNPANRTRIAHVPGFTNSRQWNKFPEQRSSLIHLEAGQHYYIEALQKEGGGGDNLAVRWALPDGTIQEPIPGSVLSGMGNCIIDDELTVTQIAGPTSGSNFPVGETPIIFEVTDACGNLEVCEFNVTIEENPADFEINDCSSDITINTLPGAITAVATFNEPSGTSTCFRGGPVSVVQNLGLESGEAFPIGTTQITYAVFDSCGNFEGCNFNVNVVEIAAAISLTCPEDVILQATNSSNIATATWIEPTASTDCFAGGLTSVQVSGPANGSDLAVGVYPVIYVFTDDCNNTEICTFDVVVNSCSDMDGDGVCAADDCDDNDASLPATPGTTCDDNNENTINDVIGADGCSCAGVINPCVLDQIVTVSSSEELCAPTGEITFSFGDTNGRTQIAFSLDGGETYEPNVLDNIGSITYDGLTAGTYDLMVRWGDTDCPTELGSVVIAGNGASPEADFTSTPVSCGASDGSITFSFEDAPNRTNLEFSLDGGNNWFDGVSDLTSSITYGGLAPGTYELYIRWGDNDCPNPLGQVTLLSNESTPGTACNDGDASTENDVIGADGCSCAGTPIVNCTVAGGQIAFLDGSTTQTICADDGVADPLDVNLFGPIGNNQQWIITDSEQNILGLPTAPPFNLEGAGGGTCLIYSLSFEDGVTGVMAGANLADFAGCLDLSNAISVVRLIGSECPNQVVDNDNDGIPADEDCDDNNANLPATPGTSCNDGDADTENDVIGADGCSCAGTPIVACANEGGDADGDGFCADVDCDDNDASLPATPGTTCDDGDAATENDVIGTDGCSCAGTPISTGPDCANIVITPGAGNITVSGLNAPINSIQIFNASWGLEFKCFGDCDVPQQIVDGLAEGTYFVKTGLYTSSYQLICAVENNYTVLGGDACAANGGDADGDGFCADVDCDDNNASLPATPGTTCDDGDADTENDVILADGCGCAGTPIVVIVDNDNDGVPAGEDCDDNDASIPTAPGTTCDDGDVDTENDVILADGCECAGTPIVVIVDNDNDGVPAGEDCDDNDASIPTAPGTTCDDGDADTENDVIGADGCSCAGTPINTGCNPGFILSPGNITVTGLNGAVNIVKILDISNGYLDVVNCFGDCPTPASFDLPEGPYRLVVTIRDASGVTICELNETIEILDGCTSGASCNDGDDCTTGDVFDAECNCAGTLVVDNDGDGFCAVEDCDDNDASLPATPGSTCDDGNADTTGDVYQADGCTCAGVVVGACNPTATPGDSTLTIAGLSGPFNVIQIFNTANWSTVINCWGDCHNQVLDVDPGTYLVRLKVLDENYQVVCEMEDNITVGGVGTFSIAPDTEFLRLFAREENRTVGLNWVNNSEYRNDYFVVERSVDGINFTELKTVDAYGYQSQAVTNYEDEDIRPALGEGFYRVRQVFEDGTLRYSNVEKVSFDIDLTEVGLFPNPAETEVQLSLIDFAGRSAEVQIYSPLGVLMDAVSLEEIPARAIRFNVAGYQAGLYTITVKVDQRKRFSKRFVKMVD